ncbi:coatomer subunit alpha [Podila epigama]|nr:coatomer subunit alpha [Podila epigama]
MTGLSPVDSDLVSSPTPSLVSPAVSSTHSVERTLATNASGAPLISSSASTLAVDADADADTEADTDADTLANPSTTVEHSQETLSEPFEGSLSIQSSRRPHQAAAQLAQASHTLLELASDQNSTNDTAISRNSESSVCLSNNQHPSTSTAYSTTSNSSNSNSTANSTNSSPRSVVRKRHRITAARLVNNGGIVGVITSQDKQGSKPTIPHSVSKTASQLLAANATSVTLDIDEMMSALSAKKRELKARDQQVELEVLFDFLRNTRAEKEDALARLNSQIHCLDKDMRKVKEKLDSLKRHSGTQVALASIVDEREEQAEQGIAGGAQVPNEASEEEEDEAVPAQLTGSKRSRTQLEFDEKGEVISLGDSQLEKSQTQVAKRINVNKKRVAEHFEDLQRCYFDFAQSSSTKRESGLSSFCSTISKFTKFSRFEHINTLRYGDIYNTSSIVSSIEFDRDDEYFATAGVTKKIKIFEYGCIEKTGLMGTSQRQENRMQSFDTPYSKPLNSNKRPITSVLHYPVLEMMCRSKISCLSWNSYIKSQIASSDYEGIVSLWDSHTGVNTLNYEEHEKRAWSVDFSRTNPTQLASGSDDAKVKIWSVTQRSSVCTIESKANICCVKFNPESSHHIAFGSADHHIHYYDLRKANDPLFVFKGHRKAVSYVKFLGREELVSASTDSTLKLWNTSQMSCVRTYTGHCNEKNFVGLSASGDWISCGSENNSVYTYYKELRDPVVTVKFGNSNPLTGEESMDDDPTQFVSSVCWKKDTSSNILLAANSSGVIKVLQLK